MTMIHLAPMTDAEASATTVNDDAGLGTLRTERGNLPLDRIDLRADITGLISAVTLTQEFVNVHDAPLEATYVFPLPDRAAVTGMTMTAADHTVTAELRERGEARQAYDEAIATGQRAAIAEEERPDVFTMRVGNIVPGERVTITLSLAGQLSTVDGEAEFRFPLVVAPRYIPGAPLDGASVGDGHAPDTDAVPDASRITPPVLLPGFPNPVRLSISVGIDPAGLPLGQVRSSLHAIVEEGGRVRVQPGERANRDFILRFGYDGATSAVVEPMLGMYQVTVFPPPEADLATPRDVVLLLDRSGSMQGWKMVAARRAAARIVDTLTDADRFAVLTFDDRVEAPPALPSGLVQATDRHRFRAVEHLAGVEARGGTELLGPLRDGLALLAGSPAADRVLVLVTDGQVGNEDQILRDAAAGLAGVRVHTVGIDQAVNAGFLGRLAAAGGGRCELVESEDRLDEAMDRIHRRIGSPLVTGVTLDADGLSLVEDTRTPVRLSDLFPGVPYTVMGRFDGDSDGATLTLRGKTRDGREWSSGAPVRPVENPALGAVWARAHLRDLEDRYVVGRSDELEKRIVETSLKYGVLCRFTAYLAVDTRVVAEGGDPHRIIQPVESPAGWEMFAGGPKMKLASMSSAPGSAGFARAGGSRRARGIQMAADSGSPMDWMSSAMEMDRSAPAPAAMPAPARPALHDSDEPAVAGLAGLAGLADIAAEEARRLRAASDKPEYQRRELLEDLGSRLAVLATGGPLRRLADLLRPGNLAARPLDEVWTEALRLLDEAAAAGGRREGGRGPGWRGDADRGSGGSGSGGSGGGKREGSGRAFWRR